MVSRKKLRIYPLRLNKNKWRIPIHTHHQCSDESCSFIIDKHPSQPNTFFMKDNPDYKNGKCPLSDHIERGAINISSTDILTGLSGPIHNPKEIVIPDEEINIQIDYPLTNPVLISINFGHPNITRSELLYSITSAYKHIYDMEENTSPTVIYTIKEDCKSCINAEIKHCIHNVKKIDRKQMCAICIDSYNSDPVVKLPCKHSFHDKCIKPWIEKNNNCPLCRKIILNCNDCSNNRYIYKEHESVVIPIEHRGDILNRNRTYGVFGIYGYDLKDLSLFEMYYNRIKKTLYLGIISS